MKYISSIIIGLLLFLVYPKGNLKASDLIKDYSVKSPQFLKDTFIVAGKTFQILEHKSGRNLNAQIKNGEIKIINQGVQYFEYRVIYYVFSSLDDDRMPVVRSFDGRLSYPVVKALENAAVGNRYIFEEIIIVDKAGIRLNNEVRSILIERIK